MGAPKKKRKKYETPRHPWQASRIESETQIQKEYGLKNKREIWKIKSLLRKYTSQAKRLANAKTEQDKKEREQLIKRLFRMGLVNSKAVLDDVLNLTLKNFLDRRLQTLLFKKNLAKTMRQARQFITHQHVIVGNKLITSPSYIVLSEEEDKILFKEKSPLANVEHKERIKSKETPKKKVKRKIVKVIKHG